jgi:signal transduction histidine kinase
MIHPLDGNTITAIVGLLYLLLPLGVGFILQRQDAPRRLAMWIGGNLGSAALAFTACLSQQDHPSPVGLLVGMTLGLCGLLLRATSLRLHLGRSQSRLSAPRSLGLLVVAVLGFEIALSTSVSARSLYGTSVSMLGAWWLATIAFRLGRLRRMRSADVMAATYVVLGTLMGARIVDLLQGHHGDNVLDGPVAAAMAVAALFTAVFSNVAYIGITLEGVRAREQARQQEAFRATAAQRYSEAQSAQLRELLRERDEMLHLLAHEVRQPLNSASAALQSARSATLRTMGDTSASALLGRLDRAGSVIQQITSILDNTLAASSLISSDSRLAPVEADLPSLVELCLADLAPPQRARVHVEHDPGLRTAAFDPGLLRLALRNLLVNALNHAPPDTPVVLRVSEQDEPLAVRFEVIDQGPGFDPALREHAFERGVRGRRSHGLGLGLYIARRVAELHHGHLEIVPPTPPGHGAWLRLTLPQDPID